MRKILMQAKSKTFPKDAMWNRIINIKDYPKTIKFCKSIMVTEIKEDAYFEDVTTLLWLPLKIKHIITTIKDYKEIVFFLPLSLGGKMWHKFTFKQKGKDAIMLAEITFDLGNKFFNNTVGYILEKRWEDLMLNAFPEVEDIKRLQ